MTLRAKPVVKGPGRSGWHSEDRRTLLTNVAFVAAIVISVLILAGYAGYSWWNAHLGPAATVDGTTITKDQLAQRVTLETFRINYTEARIRTLQNAGYITATDATNQLQYLDQRLQSVQTVALERLIDIVIQSKLASQEGISVSSADVDAQLLVEKTVVELRHAWVIEVAPDNDPATGTPGDAQKSLALAKAQAALNDLKAGKVFEDVAKADSTASSAAQGGDLGYQGQDNGMDSAFMTALWAAPKNQPTAVVLGADGIYRIGRWTDDAPSSVDSTFETQLQNAGIQLADYRAAISSDLIRKDLEDKLVADLSQPSKQRHVLQIFISVGSPMTDGVKVRHILISPKHDPNAALSLPLSDPAWKAAKDEATAIYNEVVADPTKFDELARTKSDESSARTTGGKLPYYDQASIDTGLDKSFATAILTPGLKPGQILPPVQSAYGWHVIQIMRPYGNGEEAWLKQVRAQIVAGADFAQLARDQGEGPEAAVGGDIGWVARGQLTSDKETAIFNTPVGGLSDVVNVSAEGVYLWKVLDEQVMTPTASQIATFKSDAFNNWYALKKAVVKITRYVTTTTTTQ